MSDLISTNTAAKYGIFSAGAIGSAIVLLALKKLPLFVALIAGAVLLFFGIGLVTSKKSGDKIPGLICAGAGALTLLSLLPFLTGFANGLLGLGALALFAAGIWNAVKFILALRSRS
ncbi:MAG: hypothetical protein FWG07_01545 [Treponema sp.]|nr:hypothetical protein [Treponema sp.]